MSQRDNPNLGMNTGESGQFRILRQGITTPEDRLAHRTQLIAKVNNSLTRLTHTFSPGLTAVLDIAPTTQGADNTCMLACGISIAQAVDLQRGIQREYSEAEIAQRARAAGILAEGGISSPQQPRQVGDFFQAEFGITLHQLPIDPFYNAGWLVQGLVDGRPILINSRGHFVTVFGISRNPDESTSYRVMNPLSKKLQDYSVDDLTQRLVGNTSAPELPDGPAEVYIVQIPEAPALRILRQRRT